MPNLLLRSLLLATAAILVATATPSAKSASQTPGTEHAYSRVDSGDCDVTIDLVAREACFASLSPELIDECETMQPFRCAPFRDMHLAGIALSRALDELVAATARIHNVDTTTDPTYGEDVEAGLVEADRSWRAWRDAECTLIPYLDGMSRRTAAGLAEACRAEMTFKRAAHLRALKAGLEPADR